LPASGKTGPPIFKMENSEQILYNSKSVSYVFNSALADDGSGRKMFLSNDQINIKTIKPGVV
jgi:hypothetical protein